MRLFWMISALFLAGCQNISEDLNIYSFDESEEALLSQAQKQFQHYHYDDVVRTLDSYERLYPLSPKIIFIEKLLMEAYLGSEDYPMLKAAADRFIYENPQDPDIDYVSYLRFLSQVQEAQGFPMKWLPIDRAQRDVSAFKEAFISGKTFLQKHPQSPYAPAVARQMPELKEMVAKYYLWRGNDLFSRHQYIGGIQAYQMVTDQLADTESASQADRALKNFENRLNLVEHREFPKKSG